jgi:outer membrane protein W
MRKLIVCLLAIVLTLVVSAQSNDSSSRRFKPFKVTIAAGYASPKHMDGTYQYSGGALFSIEPQYAIIDPLSIGIRVEAALTGHLNNSTGGSDNSSGTADLSYLLTLNYYFTNTGFRPFIGGGTGIYTTATIDSSTTNSSVGNIPRTSQFGSMIRAGFEIGHLRLAAEYNFVANNASYLGLKLGISIGGGRRRA